MSQPDVGAAVSPGVPHLVGQHRTLGLLAKVHQEVGVQGQPPCDVVDVQYVHLAALPVIQTKKHRVIFMVNTNFGLLIKKSTRVFI